MCISEKNLFLFFISLTVLSVNSWAIDPNNITAIYSDPNSFNNDPNDTNQDIDATDPFVTERNLLENSYIPSFIHKCDNLFKNYVNDKKLVDYSRLRRYRGNDLIPIQRLMDEIHPAHILNLEPNDKKAFWINVYNVCTLSLIIENYPIQAKWYMIQYPDSSIMQISNAWTKVYFNIQDLEYSLREIEYELLFNRFDDPRICFALSYASLGGPRLRQEAYIGTKIDAQLNDQVQKTLSKKENYYLDRENATINLSVIFSTHKEIFLKSKYASIKKFRQYNEAEQAWLNFLVEYIPKEDIEFIENNECKIKFINYNWLLDEG